MTAAWDTTQSRFDGLHNQPKPMEGSVNWL